MVQIIKSPGQIELFHALNNYDIIFLNGLFGTGKTFISIKAACEYLTRGIVKRIVITRSIIECGRGIGFLPGDIDEKISPYFVEHKNYANEFLTQGQSKRTIEYQPIELLRSRNYDDCFIILDEAQNCDRKQILMLISRMGINSKLLIVGDTEQSDIPNSFFITAIKYKEKVKNAAFISLTEQDFFRNKNALEVYHQLFLLS